MNTSDNKQLTQLSDEDLKQVRGGQGVVATLIKAPLKEVNSGGTVVSGLERKGR